MANFLDKLKVATGFAVEPSIENPTLLSQMEESTTLTRGQRLTASAVSLGLSALFFGLGVLMLMTFHVKGFAIFFTAGNLSSIAATCFIVGPKKQLQNMLTNQRMAACGAYFGAMALTLFVALRLRSTLEVVLVVIPCIIMQLIALIWYLSTWLPGGQGLFLRMFGASAAGFGEGL